MASAAMRAVVLVAVALMQCCKVIVAERPLLEAPAVAGGDGVRIDLIRLDPTVETDPLTAS